MWQGDNGFANTGGMTTVDATKMCDAVVGFDTVAVIMANSPCSGVLLQITRMAGMPSRTVQLIARMDPPAIPFQYMALSTSVMESEPPSGDVCRGPAFVWPLPLEQLVFLVPWARQEPCRPPSLHAEFAETAVLGESVHTVRASAWICLFEHTFLYSWHGFACVRTHYCTAAAKTYFVRLLESAPA